MSQQQDQQQQQQQNNDQQQNSGSSNVGPQNDEAFTSFLFAIVSCIMLVVYGPLLFRLVRELFSTLTGGNNKQQKRQQKKKPENDPSSPEYDPTAPDPSGDETESTTSLLSEGFEDALFIFNGVKFCVSNPGQVAARVAAMRSHPDLTWRYIVPRVRRFVVRPKVILLAVWFILLSSVLYTTLTYDPYAVLGLDAATASFGEVKKVYRALTKINHPDHNKTDAAKAIFPMIKKAYKTIHNKEKGVDEKEETPDEFSVGIALPSWMISGKSKGLTMLVLLGALIAVPALLFHFLGQNQNAQLERIYSTVLEGNLNVESVLTRIGIPEDKVLLERRTNRSKFFKALIDVGAIDPKFPPALIDKLPPLKDFKTRLVSRKQYMMQNYGFLQNEQVYQALVQRFAAEDQLEKQQKLEQQKAKKSGAVAADSSAAAAATDSSSPSPVVPFSLVQVESEFFLLQQILFSIFKELEVFTNIIGAETTTVRKTLRVHDSIVALIQEFIKNGGKLGVKQIAELNDLVRKLDDLYKELRDAADTIREHRMRQKMEEAQKLQEALHESRNTVVDDD